MTVYLYASVHVPSGDCNPPAAAMNWVWARDKARYKAARYTVYTNPYPMPGADTGILEGGGPT